MRTLLLTLLCVMLLAGCGKRPNILDVPTPPVGQQ